MFKDQNQDLPKRLLYGPDYWQPRPEQVEQLGHVPPDGEECLPDDTDRHGVFFAQVDALKPGEVCTCQLVSTNPFDCELHGHMFGSRVPRS